MECNQAVRSICTLKVNIKCCKACPQKAKKLLQQVDGVTSFTIDPSKGLISVIGDVDHMVLIKTLAKMHLKAELWSFQKEPIKTSTTKASSSSKKPEKHDLDDSSDTECHDEVCENSKAPKHTVNWRKPSECNCSSGKKDGGKNQFNNFLPPNKGFFNDGMSQYSSIRPVYHAQWNHPVRPRAYNRPPHPPPLGYPPQYRPMPSRQAAYYYGNNSYGNDGYGHGYGYDNHDYGYNRARSTPPVNPMIHYTSYMDNYRYW